MAERRGVSRTQVVCIERRGYDTCSLAMLRGYVEALGGQFTLEGRVRPASDLASVAKSLAVPAASQV